MNLSELQKALRDVEPAAVLVPPRVLESIVTERWKLSGLYWNVPHRRTFIIDRQTLFRHVEQDELVVGPDEVLPATVILLAWPIEISFSLPRFGNVRILGALWQTSWATGTGRPVGPTTEEIGRLFMSTYLLPFEAASVLLLVALMGAAMIVRRRKDA